MLLQTEQISKLRQGAALDELINCPCLHKLSILACRNVPPIIKIQHFEKAREQLAVDQTEAVPDQSRRETSGSTNNSAEVAAFSDLLWTIPNVIL